MKRPILGVVLGLVALLSLAAPASSQTKPQVGDPAPLFEIKDWLNYDSDTTIESLAGKVYFLEAWATW